MSNTDERLQYAASLVEEALDAITYGHPDHAVWRLVDAVGMCARVAESIARDAKRPFTLTGFTSQTGRGFQVIQHDAPPPQKFQKIRRPANK